MPEPLVTFYMDEGETTEVAIEFDANPTPTNDLVIWHVVSHASNQSYLIEAGQARERFESRYLEFRGSTVIATLLVHQATYDDVLSYWYLEASNSLGRFEYQFELQPRPMETEEPDDLEVRSTTTKYSTYTPA